MACINKPWKNIGASPKPTSPMATNTTGSDVDPGSNITVTEVWPDRFELTFDSDCDEMSAATTYKIDRGQLQLLRQRIDEALR